MAPVHVGYVEGVGDEIPLDRRCAGEPEKDLLGVVLSGLEELLQLTVVAAVLRKRLLEDGRVRGDTDDGIVVQMPLETAAFDHRAGERVEPDALAERGEVMEW